MDNDYPLLQGVDKKSDTIINLLIDYADCHSMILDINDNDNFGNYPFYQAIGHDSKDNFIFKPLIHYANHKNIKLEINKKRKIPSK